MKNIILSNGYSMPLIGFGTARILGNDCIKTVCDAIKIGYRLIDTACLYNNEKEVGIAIANSTIKREELFITSKLYSVSNTYDKAKEQINDSLKSLGLDYIDLYLIHEPFENDVEAYKALEDAYKKGVIRAIGVSNYNKDLLDSFINKVEIKPMVNQIECHPLYQELEFKEYMEKLNIKTECYAPFASGFIKLEENEVLKQIAKNHSKTIYQIILNYFVNQGIIVIPKTVNKERMIENLNSFDFNLTTKEILDIKSLDVKKSLYGW